MGPCTARACSRGGNCCILATTDGQTCAMLFLRLGCDCHIDSQRSIVRVAIETAGSIPLALRSSNVVRQRPLVADAHDAPNLLRNSA
eukprot:7939550-Pyramimonas_sp.AAC.1